MRMRYDPETIMLVLKTDRPRKLEDINEISKCIRDETPIYSDGRTIGDRENHSIDSIKCLIEQFIGGATGNLHGLEKKNPFIPKLFEEHDGITDFDRYSQPWLHRLILERERKDGKRPHAVEYFTQKVVDGFEKQLKWIQRVLIDFKCSQTLTWEFYFIPDVKEEGIQSKLALVTHFRNFYREKVRDYRVLVKTKDEGAKKLYEGIPGHVAFLCNELSLKTIYNTTTERSIDGSTMTEAEIFTGIVILAYWQFVSTDKSDSPDGFLNKLESLVKKYRAGPLKDLISEFYRDQNKLTALI